VAGGSDKRGLMQPHLINLWLHHAVHLCCCGCVAEGSSDGQSGDVHVLLIYSLEVNLTAAPGTRGVDEPHSAVTE
jgi:hypothetical protein